MAFCYQTYSSDREKLLKFEAEGQEFAKFLRSLEQYGAVHKLRLQEEGGR